MRRPPTSKGWDSLAENPVPGDVAKSLFELGVEIIREVDNEIIVRCPAHIRITGGPDRHPSCSVNIDSGLVNCFSCGWKGTFVTVVTEMLNCNELIAIDWIKERGSIDRAVRLLGRQSSQYVETPEEEPITEADLAIYDPVPARIAARRHLTDEALANYGVLWDKVKKHWIIPVRDPNNQTLLGWQIKGEESRLFKNQPTNVQKSRALFGSAHMRPFLPVIVVESPLDAVRLSQVTDTPVVSVYGSKISRSQAASLLHGAASITLALDNDKSGWEGTEEFIDLYAGRKALHILNYSRTRAKDVGDMRSDHEIEWSVQNAHYWSVWNREMAQEKRRRKVRHGSNH